MYLNFMPFLSNKTGSKQVLFIIHLHAKVMMLHRKKKKTKLPDFISVRDWE